MPLDPESEQSESSPLLKRETIERQLLWKVRALTPEQLKEPEKKEQIMDAVTNGLDLIASDVAEEVFGLTDQAGEESITEIALKYLWSMKDFARSILVHPLPPQAFEYEDEEIVPLEATVADENNWWEVLSLEQKKTLSELVGLDLTKADTFTPSEKDQNKRQMIEQGKMLTHKDGSHVIPMLIWTPHDGPGLSAIWKEQSA